MLLPTRDTDYKIFMLAANPCGRHLLLSTIEAADKISKYNSSNVIEFVLRE
jgi:hypothetical protein